MHIIFHLYMDRLHQSCCYACGNMLWLKLQVTENSNTHPHTHTHCTSHTWWQPLPWPPHCACHRTTNRHMDANNTHLLRPSNTSDPEPRLTAKASWVMNQGEDQRSARDGWAEASTAKGSCCRKKAHKSLAWLEPWQTRSELSFYRIIMTVSLFF